MSLTITAYIFHMIHISVTESGLGCYGLQPFGPGSGYEPVVDGSFAGLAILGPESEFPVILTTSKTDQCCFLEMRGTCSSSNNILTIYFPDYISSLELFRRIPLSCVCSINLEMSSITHLKVDEAEQVYIRTNYR